MLLLPSSCERNGRSVDPCGKRVLYDIDSNGDLASFTDRESNATSFSYGINADGTQAPPHYLTQIHDPRGVQAARYQYDNDGRLIQRIDAKGHITQIVHDLIDDADGRREIVTDRMGRQSVLSYDGYGNVTKTTRFFNGRAITTTSVFADANNPSKATRVTDALGHTTTYTYDANGKVLTTKDPLGHVTTVTYDALSHPLTVIDALGKTLVTNTYDAKERLISKRDARGFVTTFTYFPNGNPQTVTDARGNVTTFGLNSDFKLGSVTDALGHVVSYAYDADGNKTSEVTTRTNTVNGSVETLVTRLEYDKDGRVVKTTAPDGAVSQAVYNAIGQVGQSFDSLGRVTSHTYDELGQATGTVFPDGTTAGCGYDAGGQLASLTDRAARTVLFDADDLGRRSKTTHADGLYATYGYDDAGRDISVTDENGHMSTFAYDDAGRSIQTTDALGNSFTNTYDAAGRRTAVTNALGQTTNFTLDAAGHLTKTTFSNGSIVEMTYDEVGNTLTKKDQAGHVTTMTYDKLNRLQIVRDALGRVTTYGYDELGHKVTQIDAKGRTTHFDYDMMGRLVRHVLPSGQTESKIYDIGGRVTSKTDFNGFTTTFTFDTRDRILSKTPDARTGQVAITYSYPDELHKVISRGSSTTSYTFDAKRGYLLQAVSPNGTISYGYDAAGHRTTVTTSSGTTTYGYDADNRLTDVTAPDGKVTHYTYNALGKRLSVALPNGITTRYGYDALNRLSDMSHVRNDGAANAVTLSRFHYDLLPDGKRQDMVETLLNNEAASGGATTTSRTVNYVYDASGRLTDESGKDGSGVLYERGYTYDEVGNRTQMTAQSAANASATTLTNLQTTTSTYNDNDWLTGSSTTNGSSTQSTIYGYDANGNQTTVTSGGVTTNYAYDFENRLNSVGAVGGSSTKYAYDGSGNRLSVTSNVGQASEKTTRFLNDVNRKFAQVVEEQDGSGMPLVRYTYGAGNSLIRQQRLTTSTTPAATSYYLSDGLSSTRQLSDSAGSVTDSSYYDAYGNGLAGSTSSTLNSYGFNGQQKDDTTGGYYLRARYYAPNTGRFLSQDPFGGDMERPSSLHRYNYSHGDPVNYADPGGEEENAIGQTTELAADTIVEVGVDTIGEFSIESIEEGMAAGLAENVAFDSLVSGTTTAIVQQAEDAVVEAAIEELTEPLEFPEEMPPTDIDTDDSSLPWYRVSLTGIPLYTGGKILPPMPVTANHIFSAIMGLGEPMQPIILTRVLGGKVQRRTAAQRPKVKLYGQKPFYPLNPSAPNMASPGAVVGTWDEYPFAMTAECGTSSPFFPATSVWLTPSIEYRTQSQDITGFLWDSGLIYSNGRFGVMVLP